jgi:hypothetical protein
MASVPNGTDAFLFNHAGGKRMKGKADRILTGHRPTGPRHIGHLAGTDKARPLVRDSLAPIQEKMGLRSPLHETLIPHKKAFHLSLQKNPLGFI